MPESVRMFAPAKLNLGLSVLGKRPDGYHDLSTLMVPLTVGDELDIRPAAGLSLAVQGADLPTDRGNLVYRAAELYLNAAGHPGGAQLTLHKHLPLASGLGGGSSDAASTLLALSTLYPSEVHLPELARRLGADVPFFLGGGPALAEGIGERLSPLTVPPLWVVLLNPGVAVSAADAYTWLAETGRYTPPLNALEVITALAGGQEVPYFNALQPGVLARHAEVAAALEAVAAAGLGSPLMSGSGSTVFGLAGSEAQARSAAARLQTRFPGWWARAAQLQGGLTPP
ncbi:4-(cytidine 5'-diphospho)-2-C-methyl-D-erythritol kinase [Deinococcus irradiatisoli]|uniref:4-diphosphocytidyl-2-C-methyl-D-erythritol kinase n=1 Tax=Deinococcus irradiatisoli TaxID=2202254 RepID=A0A2Z3JJ01_9DEIO|nr:4-(cytidine 5'-diphospho)-2-C-methyl-D-erythritol kinase [Deinococcus irradiatisoli]AWN21928.1 4-(cytidine 5'-diphospho)-2-C-methyl-D-erythritol kinase [Deinococcus irradiatisoli]